MKKLNAIFAISFIYLMLSLPMSFAYIQNVNVNIGTTTATINWETNTLADSRIDYGLTTSYGQAKSDPTLVTNHVISLSGLFEGKEYSYKIRSVDSNDQISTSTSSFKTNDLTPPKKVLNLNNGTIQVNALYIYWDSTGDDDVDNYLVYKNNVKIGSTKTESYYVAGLSEGIQYSFSVQANDTSGNLGLKSDSINLITKDSMPPKQVTGLSKGLISNDSVSLQWNSVSDSDLLEYLVYVNGAPDYSSYSNSYKVTGLNTNTNYEFYIAAVDKSGNKGEKSESVFAKTSTTQNNLNITNVQFSGSVISWNTNDFSNSSISYGKTSLEFIESADDHTKNHVLSLANLENSQKYIYIITSCTTAECSQSEQLSFIAGYSSVAPEINVNVPEYYSSRSIDLEGSTKPQSLVKLYVNDVLRGQYPNTGDSGDFSFLNIPLDGSIEINVLKFFVRDFSGVNSTKEFSVRVDTDPLLLNLSLPEASASQNLELIGNINKKSDIKIYVVEASENPPVQVENLTATAQGNQIRLQWSHIQNSDNYLIYRTDVGLIGKTNLNSFTDSAINKSKTYTYYITATDRLCREGTQSDSLSIASESTVNFDRGDTIVYGCEIAPQKTLTQVLGNFRTTANLKEGNNLVRIEVFEIGGAYKKIEKDVLYDTRPIQLISPTDLSSFSPIYSPSVTIKGQTNKKAKIHFYINRELNPSITIDTDPAGHFSKKIDLTNYNTDRSNDTQIDYTFRDVTAGRTTNVKIVAEDYLGRTSNAVIGDIVYSVCSYGFWWKINSTNPTPDALIPRLIKEGLAQVGISYNLDWQGGLSEHSLPTNVRVRQRPLSLNERTNWDENWISNTQTQISYDAKSGHTSISLKAIDPFPGDTSKTEQDREENISKHRYTSDFNPSLTLEGQYECSKPGFGCVKLPLMIELTFSEDGEKKVQRQCWDVEISIDRKIPPASLSKKFLKRSINLLNNTIGVIDLVLNPLENLLPTTFYTCVGSMAVSYVWSFWDGLSSSVTGFLGGAKINNRVPEQGLDACYIVYCQNYQNLNTNEKKNCDACVAKAKSVDKKQWFDKKSNWVCDRIFSPPIPTLQKYIEDNSQTGEDNSPITVNNKLLYQKSICQGIDISSQNILNIYNKKKKNQDRTVTVSSDGINTKSMSLADYCKDDPYSGIFISDDLRDLCCMYNYVGDWQSGCLLMDIDKESACLAAEIQNDKSFSKNNKCNNFINSIAGVCEVAGKQKPELINTYKPVKTNSNLIPIPSNAIKDSGKYLYLAVFKPTKEDQGYVVKPGIIIENWDLKLNKKDIDLSKISKKGDRNNAGLVDIQASTKLYLLDEDYTTYFQGNNLNKADGKKYNGLDGFHTALNKYFSSKISITDSSKIYDQVISIIGVPDKQYVVDPTSGLIRSVQCVSLPALKSYLEWWKTALTAAKDCFTTILETGDGSAGVCRSLVSVYMCDLIYDAISCFMQKYPAQTNGVAGESRAQGLAGVFSSISDATSKVSSRVKSRYGDTTTFNLIFGERKLVHAVCLFAFTGDWVFDVESALQSNNNIPIKSDGFIAESTRRYISYNPVAQQGGVTGLSTFNYHVALMLIAGSDIKYSVKLYCSQDYSCDDDDYASGKCDCAQGGTAGGYGNSNQHYSVNGNYVDITSLFGLGQLKKGEILNKEIDFLATNHFVRYDKVVLEYDYVGAGPNEKPRPAQKHITLAGGKPPAYCEFDTVSLKYRCSLNMGNEQSVQLTSLSSDKDVYEIGDPVKIYADVSNKIPASAPVTSGTDRNEYTKYLTLQIKDIYGNVFFQDKDAVFINEVGRETYTLPQQLAGTPNSFTVQPYMLTGTAQDKIQIKYATTGLTTPRLISAQTARANFVYAVKFVNKNSKLYYEIYEVPKKESGNYLEQDIGSDKKLERQVQTPINLEINYQGITVKFTNPSADKVAIIEYTPAEVKCIGEISFIATASIYSSEELFDGGYGKSNQLTFYQGAQNKKDLRFKVKCPNTYNSLYGDNYISTFSIGGLDGNAAKSDIKVKVAEKNTATFNVVVDESKLSEIQEAILIGYSEKGDNPVTKSTKTDVKSTQISFENIDLSEKFYRVILRNQYGSTIGSSGYIELNRT